MPDATAVPGAEHAQESREVADLVSLIDRLEQLLDRSALSELEVEAGGTTVVLRKPGALAGGPSPSVAAAVPAGPSGGPRTDALAPPPAVRAIAPPPAVRAIAAPLTGVFYLSPSPGAAPYVRVGGDVSAGQVIGLIEAMKLFNEIKSDVSGVVRRIAADSGALVKARQTLIEVEPS
jgi:acetyl-CoA carboxylase biotin carboxyl carrier protein